MSPGNAGGPRAFKYGVTRNYVLGMEALLIGGQRIFAGKRTVKGVTGYDVASLLVGSEGTLAIFGDITLRLRVKPEKVMTILALFDGVHAATQAVGSIIAAGLVPRCMELLDRPTLAALRAAGNPLNENAGALLLRMSTATTARSNVRPSELANCAPSSRRKRCWWLKMPPSATDCGRRAAK